MKIDKKFLLDIKDKSARGMIAVRLHGKLLDYVRADAAKRGERIVDYVTKMILVKIMHDNRGKDFFEILR